MTEPYWQPIETAPKDGTEIIGQWPCWDRTKPDHVGAIRWENKWYALGSKTWAGWWVVGSGPTSTEPTLWQPFPEPRPVDGEEPKR